MKSTSGGAIHAYVEPVNTDTTVFSSCKILVLYIIFYPIQKSPWDGSFLKAFHQDETYIWSIRFTQIKQTLFYDSASTSEAIFLNTP